MPRRGRRPILKRKLAFVLPSFAGGGAERVLIRLAGALDRDRFAAELVVLDAAGPSRALVPEDMPIHDLGHARLRTALPALIARLRRLRPFAILSSLGYVNLALLAARPMLAPMSRILVREANTPSQSLARAMPPGTALAYRLFYPGAEAVLCQHERTRREMAVRFKVPPDRLRRLDNPVDVAALRQQAARPVREPGSGARLVGAGRLGPQKGFDRLIGLMADLPPATHLTLHGEGPDRAPLERQIQALGLADRVRLAGFSDNLPAALAGADLCVVSSRWEGMPNVALESLACGTPVVACDEAGGISELADLTEAVTVVPWGAAFADAAGAVVPRELGDPRPCLLPARYDIERVARVLGEILDDV